MIGHTISHYQILEKLGEGGMGLVYKARDTHLDRLVAIKVLPAEKVADPERKRRFIHEAKAASGLNHPNIVVIYDIDRADDVDFIAMEYVEGTTIAALVHAQRLPLDQVLDYGEQIADGLAAAHAAGIVHRDIKPSNLMLTGQGRVKVLDFGLAKLSEPGVGEDAETRTLEPGETTLTKKGTIVGTVAYMSPEQVEGKPVDPRSDVFSLGDVLYEMTTGRRAFDGDSAISTMAAILRDSPKPVSTLRPEVPREVERILGKCLQKDPDARYRSASDLRADLAACRAHLATHRRLGFALTRSRVAVAGLALVAIAAGAWLWVRSAPTRWARDKALPQISRLAEEGNYMAAFLLARQARQVLPEDTRLARLWDDVSTRVNIQSTPPGADVQIKEYLAPDDQWISLGTTPLERIAVPRCYVLRFKLTKSGFGSISTARTPSSQIDFSLGPEVEVPEGMVKVPDTVVRGNWGPLEAVEPTAQLGEFFIDRYEVTNRQFQQFIDAGGYQKPEYWKNEFTLDGRVLAWQEAMRHFRDATGRPGPSTWDGGTYPAGKQDFPVAGVSWYEATAYAEFVGKGLPTVFHWTWAAATWAASSYVIPLSNFGGAGPAAVGSYRGIGPHGTYDMAGNVKEWCWNQTDGKRFTLGGAWNEPTYMSTNIDARPPFDRSPVNGFRCVRYTVPVASPLGAPRRVRSRDFSKEKPVSDEVFQAYRAMYAYERTDLNAKLESLDDSAYWRRETVTFDAAYGGERVIGHLFLPKGVKPPYQAIIFFPGNGARMRPSSRRLDELLAFDYIIKSGRAFLYPVYKGTYERRAPEWQGEWSPVQARDHIIMCYKDLAWHRHSRDVHFFLDGTTQMTDARGSEPTWLKASGGAADLLYSRRHRGAALKVGVKEYRHRLPLLLNHVPDRPVHGVAIRQPDRTARARPPASPARILIALPESARGVCLEIAERRLGSSFEIHNEVHVFRPDVRGDQRPSPERGHFLKRSQDDPACRAVQLTSRIPLERALIPLPGGTGRQVRGPW
ncbi:MAG: protein kinase domain-containing protein [Bryobacteraceae bacterium]